MLITFSCIRCLNVLELDNLKQLKQSSEQTNKQTNTHTYSIHIYCTVNISACLLQFLIGCDKVEGIAAFLGGDRILKH
jgi:hypothetical protein